jgi:hypothetical protein
LDIKNAGVAQTKSGKRETENPKSEAQNPQQIQNSNSKCPKPRRFDKGFDDRYKATPKGDSYAPAAGTAAP